MPTKNSSKARPCAKLRVKELLGEKTPLELSHAMGFKFYNQIYKYINEDANPTLSMLQQLADGLTKVLKKKVKISDLIAEK